MGRWVDGEMERRGWGDVEMGRWVDGEMERWRDVEMGRCVDGRWKGGRICCTFEQLRYVDS
jgi:hypothetical protein